MERFLKERPLRALRDAVLTRDPRVIHNLRIYESPSFIDRPGFLWSGALWHVRRVLAEWMLQVCEEQKCEEEVFPLAMQYLDRYISRHALHGRQLQLLASVCMFVASKLRDMVPLSAPTLSVYTDHTVTTHDILQWELQLISGLDWNLALVLPSDFTEPLMLELQLDTHTLSRIRRHTHAYIALSSTELHFSVFSPSVVACVCVCAAVVRLKILTETSDSVLQRLGSLMNLEQDSLHECHASLDQLICHRLATPPQCDLIVQM